MDQRRRFERAPIRVPMFISVGNELYGKKIRIECRDISGGGLSFETRREVPLAANSRIVVGKLGNLRPEARIEGRVVYCLPDRDSGRYTVGVEFVKFIETTRQELIDRIHTWQAEPPRNRAPSVD